MVPHPIRPKAERVLKVFNPAGPSFGSVGNGRAARMQRGRLEAGSG